MQHFFHIKSFFNFLRRNKLFTAINVIGFAISIMFIILLGIYIEREYAVDSFHPAGDRTYRLVSKELASYPAFAGPDIESRYPEIEKIVRVYGAEFNVRDEKEEIYSEKILFADSTFFSVFGFSFIEGSPDNPMPTPQDVVITESFARKIFGTAPALGKTIRMFEDKSYIVNGVVKDFENTHLKNPAIVMPIVNLDQVSSFFLHHPGYSAFTIYLVTRPGADLAAKMPEMGEYFTGNQMYMAFNQGTTSDPALEPIREVYFSDKRVADFIRTNDSKFLSVLAVTALLILVFAVINYINLSVAQAGFRAKEAAIRRLLGGSRWQQFGGFIVESVIFCFVSLLIGLLLAAAAQPWFQQVMQTDSSIVDGLTWAHVGLALGGVLVLGFLSGCIPAFVITGFRPIEVVRGTFRRKTKMVYSKVLIAFQYCITIALVGCTVTIIRQVDYMQTSDLGFDRENIIRCRNPLISAELQAGFRDRLMAVPGVLQVSFAQSSPENGGSSISFPDDDGVTQKFAEFKGDTAYMGMLGFEIISRTGVQDADAVWLNETAWKTLGLRDDATEYTCQAYPFKIRGTVRDFHYTDFSRPTGAAVIAPLPEGSYGQLVLVKVSGGDPFGTMEGVRKIYNRQAGGNLFDGQFLDQRVQQMYENQTRLSAILGSLSTLAIIISALGMLAMSTYFIRQRAQEVAVRKVFGASNPEMLRLLLANFLKLVAVAFVIAVPVIWYLMREWLAGYAYRIPLSWTIFLTAGVLVGAVAVLTVLWQLLKAIHADPIASLKSQ